MAQGSINMPAPGKSPIEGILQALQAVHQVYGINTERQQQKLLETENAGKQQALEFEKAKYSAMQDWINRSKGGSPAAGPAAPAPGTSPMAAPGGAPAPAAPAAKSPSIPGSNITPDDLNNPFLAPQLEPMLKTQQTAQGMQLARNEETRKARGEVSGLQNEFNTQPGVKEALGDMTAAKDISTHLLSGNKLGTAGAQKRLGLLMEGVSRLGPEVINTTEAQDALSKFKNAFSKGSTGFSTPEEIAAAHQVAKLIYENAANTVDQAAGRYSSQKAPLFGQDPQAFKQKNLLPQGFGESPPEARVLPNKKTGAPTVYYLDRKSKHFLPVRNQE